MTKNEYELLDGLSRLNDVNRAYFLAILRSLKFAQEHSNSEEIQQDKPG